VAGGDFDGGVSGELPPWSVDVRDARRTDVRLNDFAAVSLTDVLDGDADRLVVDHHDVLVVELGVKRP